MEKKKTWKWEEVKVGKITEGVGQWKQEEMQSDFTAYMLDVLKNEIKNIESNLEK